MADIDKWIDVGLSIARVAVKQADATNFEMGEGDAAELQSDAAHAYQWLAIFLGLSASSPATSVSRRIQLGHEFEVVHIWSCFFSCWHKYFQVCKQPTTNILVS